MGKSRVWSLDGWAFHTTHKRVPAGSPEGGQFAPKSRPKPAEAEPAKPDTAPAPAQGDGSK